jgi:tetratricopeptide (TPR) repeat protein
LPSLTIRTRILVAFLLLLLIPTSILVFYNTWQILSLSEENASDAASALLQVELDHLAGVASDEAQRVDEIFSQIDAEITMLDLYSEGLFNGIVNVTPYQSYWWNASAEFARTGRAIPGRHYDPDYDSSDISFEVSCYYLPRIKYPGGDPFNWTSELEYLLNISSNMDYMFQNMHEGNPNYIWIYAAFAGGYSLFRNYPYDSMEWTQYDENDNPVDPADDWDPQTFEFYQGPATETGNTTVWTSPYWDPVGWLMSAGRPIRYSNGTLIGVVSVDITIQTVTDLILNISVGDNGYGFLIDRNADSISHPSQGDELINIVTLEMMGTPIIEQTSFESVVNTMLTGTSGLSEYQKNGAKWYIAYAPIPTTNYSLAVVVPELDIIGPVVLLQNQILSQSTNQIIMLLIILVIALGIMFAISLYISNRITEPIRELITLTTYIAEGDLSRELRGDSGEMAPEIGMLHDAFNNLLTSLRFGNLDYYGGDLDRAHANYQKALALFETTENERGIALAKNNIGNIYRAWGDVASAQRYYREAIEIGEQLDDKKGLASRYNNLALLMMDQGEYEQALEYLNLALDLDTDSQNDRGRVLRISNRGLVYQQRGNLDEAEAAFKESFHLAERIHYERGTAYARLHLGTLYLQQKHFEDAQTQLEAALLLAKDLVDVSLVAQCLTKLSEVHYKLGFNDEAARYENMATMLARRIVSKKYVLFVIDYSGSMGGQRIRAAINGALALMDLQVNPQDEVGIITFSSQSNIVLPMTSMETEAATIRRTIERLRYPSGNTAFYDALGDAMKVLADIKGSEQRWLIALTDGLDNASDTYTIHQKKRRGFFRGFDNSIQAIIRSSLLNVNLIIIAVGDELQRVETDLRRLTDESPRGHYIGISDRQNVRPAIEQAFLQVREILAQVDVEGISFDTE